MHSLPTRRAVLRDGAAGMALAATGGLRPARAAQADPVLAAVALMAAYPDVIVDYVAQHLVLASGRRIPIDDGHDKTFEQRLETTDPQDMFYDLYPHGAAPSPPARNFDPGRYRTDDLFREIYGGSQAEVASQLATVEWLANTRPARLQVHSKYGIADRLSRISMRLEALGPDFLPYLETPGGTFNWRPIAGTNRMSAHSYAIAIDINTGFADYWRWAGGGPDPSEYRNRIPMEIVDIFEAEDFIWGGRWYHYDTMHFEYRPELRHYQELLSAQ